MEQTITEEQLKIWEDEIQESEDYAGLRGPNDIIAKLLSSAREEVHQVAETEVPHPAIAAKEKP